jgi:WD40 repeat protein
MQLSELDWAYVQERAAYFTGRGWVFARFDQFLHGPPGVFLLLGDPGTGKTAVAAQLALTAAGRLTPPTAGAVPRRAVPVAAAYFCRAGRVDLLDAAQRLSDQLAEAVPGFAQARQATLAPQIHTGDVQVHTGDIAAGGSAIGVHIDLSRLQAETAFVQAVTLPLKRVHEAGESTQVVLLIDALDESLASQTAKELPRLLGDVEDAHLVVTARPDRRTIGWLWDSATQVDLLADAPPDSDDVLDYLERWLTPEGEPAAMAMLAHRIAEQASGNFLYAFYVVEALRDAQVLAGLDVAAAGGVELPEGGLPGVYRDFLRRELWRDGRAWSTRFGPVLAPLAVAQDEGLTTEQLKSVAGRLAKEPLTRTTIREVTRTLKQFLDSPAPNGPFRVYHQSFANFLVDPEQNPDFLIDAAETHEAIVAAYAATDPLNWDSYARRNLALHASKAGQLDHLLEDPRFLLAADPARLVPHLDAARSAAARAAATVYRRAQHLLRANPIPYAAAQLELAALQLGAAALADQTAALPLRRAWTFPWCHWAGESGSLILGKLDGSITTLAIGRLDDRLVAVTCTLIGGSLQLWDLTAATLLQTMDSAEWVRSIAITEVDGQPVLVCGSSTSGAVHVLDMPTMTARGEPFHGHEGDVTAVAVADVAGQRLVVSAGADGTVRVWDFQSRRAMGEPLLRHNGWVDALAVGDLNGTPIVICGGQHGLIRMWDLASREPWPEPRITEADPLLPPIGDERERFRTLALSRADGQPVAVFGGDYGTVRVWALGTRPPVDRVLCQYDSSLNAVAIGKIDDVPVVTSGDDDGRIQVCDLRSGQPVVEPLLGHHNRVFGVSLVQLGGRPVIVSAGYDGTVRIWDLRALVQPSTDSPLSHRRGRVSASQERVLSVAATTLDGYPVALSAERGSLVQALDMDTGELVGELPIEYNLRAPIAVGQIEGSPVAVLGGASAWALDMRTGELLGEVVGHTSAVASVAIGELDGTPVVVTGGMDGAVHLWDLNAGQQLGEPLITHRPERSGGPAAVYAVGLATIGGRPAVVSAAGRDSTLTVWDVRTGRSFGLTAEMHHGEALAFGIVRGRPIAAVGGVRSVRLWDLSARRPWGKPLTGHTWVRGVAIGEIDGVLIAVSGGDEGAVRVWDLSGDDPRPYDLPALHIGAEVTAVALAGDRVLVGTDRGLLLSRVHLRP